VLLAEDFGPQLSGVWLELFWPVDRTWYRAQCVSVNMQQQTAIITYETGELPVHACTVCVAANISSCPPHSVDMTAAAAHNRPTIGEWDCLCACCCLHLQAINSLTLCPG
jgi:hypothetical protein